MRCEVAASLLHEPKLLFLDEPTIGLDAVSKLAVRDFIKKMNREHKTTVILTTHDMQDIEAIAERVILIGKGQILLDGSLSELREAAGAKDTSLMTGEDTKDKVQEVSASGLNLDQVMAALYKKLDIM